MSAFWIVVALLTVSVLLNLCLGYLLLGRRHRHDWGDWSDWMQDTDLYSQVQALRYRTCEMCAAVERQRAGWHHCNIATRSNGEQCPHLSVLMDAGPRRIARLEKELGL